MRPLAIILFATLFLSAACTRHAQTRTVLDRADSLMTEHPDSALAILQAIDGSALSDNSALNARYALLLTQAQVKNHLPVTDDSLISIAVDYYTDHDDPDAKMLSHYYKGRTRYNREDYTSALVHMLRANEIATELRDKFWIAMSAREISAIYNRIYNHADELTYARIAYENFKEIGRQPHLLYSTVDLAAAYFNMNHTKEGMQLLSASTDSAVSNNMESLLADIYRLKGKNHLSNEEYTQALSAWISVCDSRYATREDSIYLGVTYANLDNIPSAIHIYEKYSNNPMDIVCQHLKYMISKKSHKYENALNTLSNIDSITNDILKNRVNDGISSAVIGHFNQVNQLEREKHRTATYQLWMIIISAAFAICILCWIFYRIHRRQQNTINDKIELARQLQETILVKEQEVSQAQSSIRVLLSSHFKEFDTLCKVSFESINQRQISQAIDTLIETFSSDVKKIAELEELVNTHYSNIISNLRVDYPTLKEEECRFFLFSILGFSKKALTMFLHKSSVSAIYSFRRHFIDKLRQLNPRKSEHYIAILNQKDT